VNKLLIYTEHSTNRLTYIFDFILGELLGLIYEITHDKERFAAYTGPKFSYATDPVGSEIFFEASALLFQTKVQLQPISFAEFGKSKGFYEMSERSSINFDIFASAFFMITCYNEYLPNKKDKYDRYRASQSMNFKLGFLEKPMINIYAQELKKILLTRYPALLFRQGKFEYIPTFDFDMAYSYLEKGFKKNAGGFFRSLIISDFKDISNRFNVLFRNKRDPFDTYDYIFKVCAPFRTIFFFLLGDHSKLDKNIPYENEKFRNLIKRIAAKTETGIHLSFRSHMSNEVMEEEITRLKEITGKQPFSNRFHYLRFTIPSSYLRLIKIGIKEDYSMGYASRVGFRAGTCTPFYFFNLITNEVTNLKIYPFAFMDTTFAHYNRLDPDKALEKIGHIMKYVKDVEGPCYTLWHNSSFTEDGEWRGWKNVFESAARDAAAMMKEEQ
jgi:hypothetical protein